MLHGFDTQGLILHIYLSRLPLSNWASDCSTLAAAESISITLTEPTSDMLKSILQTLVYNA